MANISITDLYPSEIESLLDTEEKEGGLIKTSINRALEVRGGNSFNPHLTGYVAASNSASNFTFS